MTSDVATMVRELSESYSFRAKYGEFDIIVACPFHKDKTPSCYIKTELYNPEMPHPVSVGTVHCFGCGKTVKFSEYVKEVMHAEGQAVSWLIKHGWKEGQELKKAKLSKTERAVVPVSLDIRDWPPFPGKIPYLENRGIGLETYRLFGCGYDPDNERVWFPVRNRLGDLVALQERSTVVKVFRNQSSGKRGEVLYGEYELHKHPLKSGERLWVCESPVDVLTLWERGYKAVGLMGASLSRTQEHSLRRFDARCLVLALDQDSAGDTGVENIRRRLSKSYLLYRARFSAKDVNDLHLLGSWTDLSLIPA